MQDYSTNAVIQGHDAVKTALRDLNGLQIVLKPFVQK